MTEIDECAFEGCTGLSKLVLPVAFRGKSEALGIPSGVNVVYENSASSVPESAPSEASESTSTDSLLDQLSAALAKKDEEESE